MAKVFSINQSNLIDSKVQEYYKLREEAKIIKSRMDTLATEIKQYASENGVKDDKGSHYCDNEEFMFGRVAKKSVKFKEIEAISFFKTNGLVNAVKTVEVIDEKEVENYIEDGSISFEDLEAITETKVTYAIELKKKEEMPVVEEVQVAASRKPKLFAKGAKK